MSGLSALTRCVTIISLFIIFKLVALLVVLLWILRRRVKYSRKHKYTDLRKPLPDGRTPLIVGFFHPYCNAGGGGERVLWVAIRALQNKYSHVKCVVYSGDTDSNGEAILQQVRRKFNIVLPRQVTFVFLNSRDCVEADKYPRFTLLGQSLGSIRLGYEALDKCVPDVYLDTMGYAFTLPLFKYIGGCTVGCYVHYPTISTDMLERVSDRTAAHNNAAFISQSPVLSAIKICYYKLFAYLYGLMGRRSDVVMVNSTWTQGHILSLWKTYKKTYIVYPPCDTEEFLKLKHKTNSTGPQTIVSIAQFRPEKDHPLQIRSFSRFLKDIKLANRQKYKLVLIGSCRNAEDETRVENLRALCQQLEVQNYVDFKINVSFKDLKESLASATVGLHSMWNEHFGIGVVEAMAAGAITLAHDSGGPKLDIVTDHEGKPTGFLANDEETYSTQLHKIFNMTLEERESIANNARSSVNRFSEKCFEAGFLSVLEQLKDFND